MDEDGEKAQGRGARGSLRRWLPLVILVAAIIAFFALGFGRYLDKRLFFQALAENREWLLGEVAKLGPIAALVFIALYAAIIALSVPGGALLTVTAGFLFGTWLGGLYSLAGATAGATIVFLIARTSFGEPLRRRAGPSLRKLEAGFQENAASYLLVLRLVPAFPFWLVNLVPAFFGVPLRTYVLFSFIGMAPATFVYASLGGGVGAVIANGDTPNLGVVYEPRVWGPLIALAMLALLPVLYRWRKGRRGVLTP